jgi:hypothetical protein
MKFYVLNEARVRDIVCNGRPGRYADGQGLYIQILPRSPRAYWLVLYTVRHRCLARGTCGSMSLGPIHFTTLAEARKIADACRRLAKAGIDPKTRRNKIPKTAWQTYRDARRMLAEQIAPAGLIFPVFHGKHAVPP